MYKYVLTLKVGGIIAKISFTARDDIEAEQIADEHVKRVYEGKTNYQWVSLVSNYDPRNN